MNTRTRDLVWGADCSGCGSRMNAQQADLAATKAGDDPMLMCGSCRDEARAADVRNALIIALSTMKRQMHNDETLDDKYGRTPFNEDMADAIRLAEEALNA